MKHNEYESLIGSYNDFPNEGILFRDVSPIFGNPKVFKKLINEMSDDVIIKNADAILAIDARGFIFGSAIGFNTSKPIVIARKPGKLPGEILTNEYELEYGKSTLSIQKNAIKDFDSFAIVDDLLATGGTVECIKNLLFSMNKKIVGLSVVIELSELNGRAKLPFKVNSQIVF